MKYLISIILPLCLLLVPSMVKAQKKDETVELSGISIIGNRELPKSLFIVPWKNSAVQVETELTNTLDEGMKPVDREVFLRELDFYDFSHSEK